MTKWLLSLALCTLSAYAEGSAPAMQNTGNVLDQIARERLAIQAALRNQDLNQFRTLWEGIEHQYPYLEIFSPREKALKSMILGQEKWIIDSLPMHYFASEDYKGPRAVFCPAHFANVEVDYVRAQRNINAKGETNAPESADNNLAVDLLVAWNRLGGMKLLQSHAPDLAQWAEWSQCRGSEFDPMGAPYSFNSKIEELPVGAFKQRLKRYWQKEYVPTGAGFAIAGGPEYTWFDGVNSQIAADGMHGGFDIGIWLKSYTASLNVNFRSFKSKVPLKLEDTLIARGVKMSMPQVGLHLGRNIVLGSHVILRPYMGVEYISVDRSVDSVYNSDKEVSTWTAAYPFGLELDLIPHDLSADISALAGLRLFGSYTLHDLQFDGYGHGTGYWRTGVYVSFGAMGTRLKGAQSE